MIRTYKRKLILTKAQEQRILSWMGVCRLVFNMGLEIRKIHYQATGKTLHKYELMKQITVIRNEYDWINDVNADCLNKVMDKLDNSYSNFFRTRKHGGGFPKFASKRKFKSINFKDVLKVESNRIKLPKIWWLKIVKDSPIIGVAKTAQIIIEPTGFFICVQCEDVPQKFVSENQTIGLDMGLSHFCIDSNGNFIANPKHFKKYEDKLRIENRSLARKKKGSNGWKKQAAKLALLHHKIGNVRKDFLHKESTILAKANCTVFMEDLNINGMVKNKRLSKHILDAGWGMFKTMLEYKTNVIKINPKYTSQTCNECGEVDSKSRISQSEFVCTSCGHVSNADVNAAKNIISKGIALSRKRESIDCALALESTNTDMSACSHQDITPFAALQSAKPSEG